MASGPFGSLMEEKLVGVVERVTFHNPETGFAVLRVQAVGRRGLVTIVGTIPSIVAGEQVEATGAWVAGRECDARAFERHPRFDDVGGGEVRQRDVQPQESGERIAGHRRNKGSGARAAAKVQVYLGSYVSTPSSPDQVLEPFAGPLPGGVFVG